MPAQRASTRRRPKADPAAARFVVQEHHATSLHWDFRLERDGVLVSWALPKGVPLDPGQNHLAVHTEDHPLEYGDFSGEIPAGEYGAGSVTLWDTGTYATEKWSDREVKVVLHGGRVQGRYVLFRTAGAKGGRQEQWMIHRMDPPPEGWEPMPEPVRPMLAQPADQVPEGRQWAYEMKWDGVRAVVLVDGGRVQVVSRNGDDVSASYPELRHLGEAVGARPLVLDGEIVAFDEHGRPSFAVLASRIHVADAGRAARLAQHTPVVYMVFDVLYADGHPTMDLPYDDRRRLLESLGLQGPAWATPPAFTDRSGADVLAAAGDEGMEGIVAKRRSARYLAGRRSDDWRKIKHFRTQEVVIGGWVPGQGRRAATMGALLMGLPEDGGLRYVGKVGTGFSDQVLEDLTRELRRLRQPASPFTTAPPPSQTAGAVWVRPRLVGEVRYSEWTEEGRLRHPSWRGLRRDKRPQDVVLEG